MTLLPTEAPACSSFDAEPRAKPTAPHKRHWASAFVFIIGDKNVAVMSVRTARMRMVFSPLDAFVISNFKIAHYVRYVNIWLRVLDEF